MSVDSWGGQGIGGAICGLRIFDNALLTETETYEEDVPRTLYERWVQPFTSFNDFTTTPFEPWLKTKSVVKTRAVPMKKAVVTPQGIFIHPAMRRELEHIMKEHFPLDTPRKRW